MSNSSLSPPPVSEPELPTLPSMPYVQPPGLLQSLNTPSMHQLPASDSVLFSAGLYSRTLLDTRPPTMQLRCLQPGCMHTPKRQLLTFKQTSNYWSHYKYSHPEIAALYIKSSKQSQGSQSSSHASDVSTLFTPRIPKAKASITNENHTYRALLLDFVVSNNLALRIADSPSLRRLIHHCNPSIITISTSTLNRDLDQTFLLAQNTLKTEMCEHVKAGGRVSITTDAWSARNYKEFIAVTGHWISKDWQQRSQLFDIVHLKEPVHSGEYLAEQLLSVTNDFNITEYIFTVTQDNASPNHTMLD